MNRKIENINKITITKPLKLDCGKTIKDLKVIGQDIIDSIPSGEDLV